MCPINDSLPDTESSIIISILGESVIDYDEPNRRTGISF
jgi:hypothetical protein